MSELRHVGAASGFFRRCTQYTAVRYLIVGGGLFGLDLLVFLTLTAAFGVGPALAQMAARGVGAGVGFIGHRYYSFNQLGVKPGGSAVMQGGCYLFVFLATFLLSPLVVVGMLDLLGGRVVLAKIMSEVVLVLISYTAMRFVFSNSRGQG